MPCVTAQAGVPGRRCVCGAAPAHKCVIPYLWRRCPSRPACFHSPCERWWHSQVIVRGVPYWCCGVGGPWARFGGPLELLTALTTTHVGHAASGATAALEQEAGSGVAQPALAWVRNGMHVDRHNSISWRGPTCDGAVHEAAFVLGHRSDVLLDGRCAEEANHHHLHGEALAQECGKHHHEFDHGRSRWV